MDYDGKYLKIRKAVHEAGFDDFCQAGSVSRFHKMNIVAVSKVLGMMFRICISGGYATKDEYYITARKLGTTEPDRHVCCKDQQEMADHINAIRWEIENAKGATK